MKKSYILVGIKGSGKSTHSKKLAEHFKYTYYDTDAVIEHVTKTSVRDVYLQKGVSWFMQMEEQVCKKIIQATENKEVIISTGGGICDNMPALLELKGKGEIVFLKQDINVCVEKILSKVTRNPDGSFENIPAYIKVYNPSSLEEIATLLTDCFTERLRIYEEISDIVVNIKEASIDDNFNTILEAL